MWDLLKVKDVNYNLQNMCVEIIARLIWVGLFTPWSPSQLWNLLPNEMNEYKTWKL